MPLSVTNGNRAASASRSSPITQPGSILQFLSRITRLHPRVAADVAARQHDRLLDLRAGVDEAVVAEHALEHRRRRDDRALADQAVVDRRGRRALAGA